MHIKNKFGLSTNPWGTPQYVCAGWFELLTYFCKPLNLIWTKSLICLSPQFICAVADLHRMRGSLEGLGTQVTSAGLEYVPRNPISLDDDQMEEASILIEALNDCPDVVRVWDNIQADSWGQFSGSLRTLIACEIFNFTAKQFNDLITLKRRMSSQKTRAFPLMLPVWENWETYLPPLRHRTVF